MVLFGFRGRSASPPKRCLGSLFCFVLPAIEQIRSNAVAPARLRHIPALDAFLDDLPLLFRGSIYAWFPAHVASCLEALNHTESGSPVLAGSTTLPYPGYLRPSPCGLRGSENRCLYDCSISVECLPRNYV